ncbi:MAG: hypothetical protein OEW15_02575 [Nitrospirota bacterium]|nr:hypothetical protein [Nitrospirota bacterium]
MDKLSKKFPGKYSKAKLFFLGELSFIGHYSDYKFEVTFIGDGRTGFVFGLRVGCYFTSSSKLKIFMYNDDPGTVLFAKRIYVRGDDFDKYYIYSNMPEEAIHYLSDNSRRSNIQEMSVNGWKLPAITGSRAVVYALDKKPQPELDTEKIETTLKNLMALRISHI